MTTSNERIENLPIVEEMQNSYLTYAMSVIMARALPDARDGLKPSQRRILVAMNDLNLGPRAAHRKCAKIAGDTSGNYHPHGEQVVYPTLVRLAQNWNMRHPLVDGQGNFGSIDGDPPAAMRYTEARLTQVATELLSDLNLETVDFEDNYDGTRQEPVVLPSRFPNLLVNGCTGIAVGMATNLPPHNLGEICDAITAVIERPEIGVDELLRLVPGPDFPTGGEICGRRGIRDAYSRGRGTIVVRGKVHVEEHKSGRKSVVIEEIPYGIGKNTITEKIAACVKEGLFQEVADVRDESGRKAQVRVVIDLKRDANEDVLINKLFKHTPLQTNYSIINIALIDRQPRTLGLRDLIDIYIDHRKDVIRRRAAFLLRKARQRAHVLEGLILAVGDIDGIIELIKGSPDPATARQRLQERPLRLTEAATLRSLLPEAFVARAGAAPQNLTATQAEAILSMQLQRLTGLEIQKLAKEYTALTEEIAEHESVLRDEAKVLAMIKADVAELKSKYATERKTIFGAEVGEFSMDELIDEERVIVTLSHQGYVKRVPEDTYRKQGRGGRGVRGSDNREGDFIEEVFTASTHDYLLVFTNRGRVYWLRVYDLPSMSRTARGRSLANLLQMQPNEVHRSVLPVPKFEENFLFFATSRGIVKKTALSAFSRPRPSGIIAIGLDPDDALIGVAITTGEQEIVLGTRDGMAVRFNESNVRAMGRGAHGVKGMTLRSGDQVVDMVAIEPGMSLLTVCEKGVGKRTPIEEYRLTRRGGKGVINIKITDKNGPVVALRPVRDTDDLMIITAGGIMLRTDLSQVRDIGRATQGVRLIRTDEGDKVVSVAILEREEGEEGEAPPEAETGTVSEAPGDFEPSAQAEPEDGAAEPEDGTAESDESDEPDETDEAPSDE